MTGRRGAQGYDTPPTRKRVEHVEVFEGRKRKGARQFYWRRVAGNGEITEQSESYTRRSSAARAARKLHPMLEVRSA